MSQPIVGKILEIVVVGGFRHSETKLFVRVAMNDKAKMHYISNKVKLSNTVKEILPLCEEARIIAVDANLDVNSFELVYKCDEACSMGKEMCVDGLCDQFSLIMPQKAKSAEAMVAAPRAPYEY